MGKIFAPGCSVAVNASNPTPYYGTREGTVLAQRDALCVLFGVSLHMLHIFGGPI